MEVNGIVAFITGGVNGIGLITATELLRNGAKNVTLVDIDSETATTVINQLNKEFGNDKAIFLKVDVRNTSQLEDAFEKTLKRFGTIDFVFNNAGVANERDFNKTIDINLKAVIAGTQLAYKHLGKHNGGKGGVIINTSSLAVFVPPSTLPSYTASKFGVLGLNRAYSQPFHYNRSAIRIITLAPGGVKTKLLNEVVPLEESIEQQQKDEIDTYTFQPIDLFGKHVLNIIRNGENGSVWLVEDGKSYLLKIPAYKDYEKTEFPLE